MPEGIEIAKEILKKVTLNGGAKNGTSHLEEVKKPIRSDEVTELISQVPNWMTRWGITLILGLIVMLVALSWLIKYPDIIVGSATLTTINPPVKLITKNGGKLTNILVSDGEMVRKNQVIAEIENPITQEGIYFLKDYSLAVQDYLTNEKTELPVFQEQFVFGIMQKSFNELQKGLKDIQELKQNDFNIQKINNLKNKIAQYKKLIRISSTQLLLLEKELKNAKEKYKAEKQLYEGGYIAKMDFYKEETSFHQKQMNFEALKKEATEQEITLINLQQELNDTEFQYQESQRLLTNNIQANLSEIENEIENWKQNYTFVAPVSGKLVWLEKIHQNQYIESGKPIFALTAPNEKYIALAIIPAAGFGKIKTGQKSRIKLNNYPTYEFGYLEGIVSKLTEIPKEGTYQVEVTLSNGMKSSYNKTLIFTPEMIGTVEIITEDLQVMQRIFNQFNKLSQR